MEKVLHGVIEQSVRVFAGFINWLGGDVVDSFLVNREKAYCDNLFECPVDLTHVSGTGPTSLSWWLDSKGEDKDGSSISKASRSGGNASRHRGDGESRVAVSVVHQ